MTKEKRTVFNLTAMVEPAHDLPEQWVAHVLEFDVVTQGDSPFDAYRMAFEAAMMVAIDDASEGVDPLLRRAPEKYWEGFYRCMNSNPKSVELAKVDASDRQKMYIIFFELPLALRAETKADHSTKPVRAALSNDQACAHP
jgi:hypothetical protein